MVALGRLDEAVPLIERLERNGARLSRSWLLAVGARCRSMWLAARDDRRRGRAVAQQAMTEHQRWRCRSNGPGLSYCSGNYRIGGATMRRPRQHWVRRCVHSSRWGHRCGPNASEPRSHAPTCKPDRRFRSMQPQRRIRPARQRRGICRDPLSTSMFGRIRGFGFRRIASMTYPANGNTGSTYAPSRTRRRRRHDRESGWACSAVVASTARSANFQDVSRKCDSAALMKPVSLFSAIFGIDRKYRRDFFDGL